MATVTPEARRTRDGSDKTVTKYVARWQDPNGRQREKTFSKKSEAEAFATKVEHEKNTGCYTDPNAGRITFGKYAAGWLDTKRATRKTSTVKSYELKLDSHILPTLNGKTLAGIRRSDVQALVNAKANHLAPSTLHSTYGVVASIFREAMRDRLIPFNPCDRIALPAKVATKVVPLTAEQVHALAEAINPHYKALVITGAGTGLRRSELFGLTVDRIDFLRRVVTVDRQLGPSGENVAADGMPVFSTPKTASSTRTVPLPQVVVDALAAHLAEYGPGPGGLVFTNTGRGARGMPTSSGRVIRHNAFYEAWKVGVRKSKVPAHTTPHDLRHTYASLLIAANESPKVIQARLGHKNISETFDTYGHLYPSSEDSTRTAIDAALGISGPPSQAQVMPPVENTQ